MSDDRSRDVSTGLTEVRTVHSRALSALAKLDSEWAGDGFWDPEYPTWEECRDSFPELTYAEWFHFRPSFQMADPDHDEIYAALLQVDKLLGRWAKRNRQKR